MMYTCFIGARFIPDLITRSPVLRRYQGKGQTQGAVRKGLSVFCYYQPGRLCNSSAILRLSRRVTMRIQKTLIAITAMLVSSQAAALNPEGFDVTNTGHLVELCSVSADDPLYIAAMGFCLGYIDAAIDYHQALTAGDKYAPIACPDTEVTREQLVAVFLDWSKGNAVYMVNETPVNGLMRAASEKWPCPAN
jgi:hypothetical protein